jgi:putative redox protein
MVKILGQYKGELHCTITHEPSSSVIYTDAPKDHAGKGEAFSPTDLIAAALGSCIATVLGIYSRRKGWNLEGMRFEVTKEMMQEPERRIGRLLVQVWMPMGLPIEDRQACERVASTCPVHRSLHPGIEILTMFHWP